MCQINGEMQVSLIKGGCARPDRFHVDMLGHNEDN